MTNSYSFPIEAIQFSMAFGFFLRPFFPSKFSTSRKIYSIFFLFIIKRREKVEEERKGGKRDRKGGEAEAWSGARTEHPARVGN